MNILKFVSLTIVMFLLSLSASAAIVTFDFTLNSDGQNQHTFTYNLGGVNLAVEAWSTADGLGTRDAQDIRSNGAGLGVEGNGSTQINTSGFPPVAEWLAFSSDIGSIVSVGISSLGAGEEADFWGSSAANFNLGDFTFLGTLNGIGAVDVQNMAVNPGSHPWMMVASSVPVQSGFRVATIGVEVPEPGMLGLLAMGLAGIAWVRRRKSL